MLTFLDLSTTRVIAGKMHSQSPILTLTKGALSNPVILTYLWEQSYILHTLTEPATNEFRIYSNSMLELRGPVKFLGHWQVQMLT